ncbi:protein of unknown function [Bradyrhizobium sp. ORS 285]|nr:hypothetical protein BRAO285_2890028 [Bradyrhizobium sp. ORS 285]SMX59689.1 protein of unknown function [Bradyrhizobium sp. ORS 285]
MDARVKPGHDEQSIEAPPRGLIVRAVIARSEATKQSRVTRVVLDCVAALAMTVVRVVLAQ